MKTAVPTKSRPWMQRARRHLILAALAIAVILLAYSAVPPPDVRHRLSMATAYAALVFLAVTLCLGPWNILRRHNNPVSFNLRRDVGIWAGALAIAHTAVGLTVHLRGRMWMYFFRRLHPPALQNTQFGFANFTGLAAAFLFLVLIVISNDVSLRILGTRSWKSTQRWVYAAFGLTVAHGIAYQLVEKRRIPWVILFAGLITLVIVIQLLGFIRMRRIASRKSRA